MVFISSQKRSTTDVVIIGGGPAGLATAIALRGKDIRCTVVDALEPPIDKGCGEGLMPDALDALKALGIEMSEEDGYPLQGIRFANNRHRVEAKFPNGKGIGVRRTHLHQMMCDHARDAGVKLLWRSHATLLNGGNLLINGEEARCGWLIGADGTSSQVRRWAGLDREKAFSQRFGFRRHYEIAPWSEYVEIHWGSTGQLYITPMARDRICVVLLTRDGKVNRGNFFDGFPEIAQRLEGAPMTTMQRGAVSVTRRLKRVANETVALVGDASGSADSITGEGLALSFRQAIALTASIERGGLAEYARVHPSIGRLPHTMATLMLSLDRWPALERRSMKVLASDESLFEELLSVHMGIEKLPAFVVRRGPLLGWRLLSSYC
ncbi:MAG: NAD(P)/FAD-dependent oxidoreductase [Edaphobacter sp.]